MNLLPFLLSILVYGLLFWLLWWLIDQFPFGGEAGKKFARGILIIIAVVVVLGWMMGYVPLVLPIWRTH